eukprot:PhF_6_TR41108/c0_g1_i2/m.62258
MDDNEIALLSQHHRQHLDNLLKECSNSKLPPPSPAVIKYIYRLQSECLEAQKVNKKVVEALHLRTRTVETLQTKLDHALQENERLKQEMIKQQSNQQQQQRSTTTRVVTTILPDTTEGSTFLDEEENTASVVATDRNNNPNPSDIVNVTRTPMVNTMTLTTMRQPSSPPPAAQGLLPLSWRGDGSGGGFLNGSSISDVVSPFRLD